MAEHLRLIKEEVTKTLSQVEADWAKSAAEKEEARKSRTPIFSAVLGYTEQKVVINGHQKLIHRVFVQTLDSGEYSKLGWVLSGDIKCCMVCSKELVVVGPYFFSWDGKPEMRMLHCHACGNVICPDCGPAAAVVGAIQNVGPVPVCNQCYYGQVRRISFCAVISGFVNFCFHSIG
jgi:hypothetical protein